MAAIEDAFGPHFHFLPSDQKEGGLEDRSQDQRDYPSQLFPVFLHEDSDEHQNGAGQQTRDLERQERRRLGATHVREEPPPPTRAQRPARQQYGRVSRVGGEE